MNVLVTGASGGLGRWLASVAFPGSHRFNRQTGHPDFNLQTAGYDLIIHTAQGARPEAGQSTEQFIDAQLNLTRRLLELPHKHFVFISSVDALPSITQTPYAQSKQTVERLLSNQPNTTIIRPASLFGPGMRPNASLRMVLAPEQPLTLAAESSFAFTSYNDVATAVRNFAALPGSFNLASLPVYSLKQAAQKLNLRPTFGNFTYTTPSFRLEPAIEQHIPTLSQNALERLTSFIHHQGYLS